MNYTRYGFSHVVGAFFEMPTGDARKILPAHLQPLEVQHTRSILALTAFHFTESVVGEYDEFVLSVIVPPMVEPGQPLPKAAFFPFMVGTSTRPSREHGIRRWHLPHYMKELEIGFTERDSSMEVNVVDGGRPVLDMVVTEYNFSPARHLYSSFMTEGSRRFKVNVYMEGEEHCEHEEERGSLVLHDHPVTAPLTRDEVGAYPFREQWMKEGLQTFEELDSF